MSVHMDHLIHFCSFFNSRLLHSSSTGAAWHCRQWDCQRTRQLLHGQVLELSASELQFHSCYSLQCFFSSQYFARAYLRSTFLICMNAWLFFFGVRCNGAIYRTTACNCCKITDDPFELQTAVRLYSWRALAYTRWRRSARFSNTSGYIGQYVKMHKIMR